MLKKGLISDRKTKTFRLNDHLQICKEYERTGKYKKEIKPRSNPRCNRILELPAETYPLNLNTLLSSLCICRCKVFTSFERLAFSLASSCCRIFFLCILPHGKADIIFSFSRHHWCWRFRKQVSVIWVPADFYEHLIQNTHKWKQYFCKTKVKSRKPKTYDSCQRFEVSKIAVLDSGFRRTKKHFEAEVCRF